MVENQLYEALSTSSSITALCGPRIYPLLIPTDTELPAINYSFIAGNSKPTQDTFGSQRYLIEVNCWGDSYGDAVTLRHAVVSTLSQYNQDGIFIKYLQPTDMYDDQLRVFRAMAEFYLFSNFVPSS